MLADNVRRSATALESPICSEPVRTEGRPETRWRAELACMTRTAGLAPYEVAAPTPARLTGW